MLQNLVVEDGYIHALKGPHGSGKSFNLLYAYYMAKQAGVTSSLFRLTKNLQDPPSIGGAFPFWCDAQAVLLVADGKDFSPILNAPEKVICIDDCHLGNKDFVTAIQTVSTQGKVLYLAGNALNPDNIPTTVMSGLLAIAIRITSLNGYCTQCKAPAFFNGPTGSVCRVHALKAKA